MPPRNTGKFGEAFVSMKNGIVESEDIELSHRECLQWAMDAAGRFLRTKQHPMRCPNDAAYFLYQQAIDQPKEFLTKVTQMEAKVDNQGLAGKRATQKSIREVDKLLEALAEPEDGNTVSPSCS